jgi:hypothetical protein
MLAPSHVFTHTIGQFTCDGTKGEKPVRATNHVLCVQSCPEKAKKNRQLLAFLHELNVRKRKKEVVLYELARRIVVFGWPHVHNSFIQANTTQLFFFQNNIEIIR